LNFPKDSLICNFIAETIGFRRDAFDSNHIISGIMFISIDFALSTSANMTNLMKPMKVENGALLGVGWERAEIKMGLWIHEKSKPPFTKCSFVIFIFHVKFAPPRKCFAADELYRCWNTKTEQSIKQPIPIRSNLEA
jgi:hypothetical protein